MFDLDNKQNCFIYGAGEQARIVTKMLNEIYDIQVESFIVSDVTNNPQKIEDIPVIGIECLDSFEKDARIIIAVSLIFVEEIEQQLFHRGFLNVHSCAPDYDFDYELRTAYFTNAMEQKGKNFIRLAASSQAGKQMDVTSRFQVFLARSHKDKVADYTKYFTCYPYVVPVQAGAAMTDLQLEALQDCTGEHISEKNGDYCELSVLYWAWKNRSSDYMGLCHYRRWFEIDESKLCGIVENQIDVVLPIPGVQLPSNQEKWKQYHDEKEWDIMCQMTQILYPEYSETVLAYGKMHMHYKYNMFIAKKEIFNQYCQWIFSILFAIEGHYKTNHIQVEGRYLGYIAENLTSIFFIHNYNQYVVAHEKVLFVDQTGRK